MTILRTTALTLSALAFSGSALAQSYSHHSGYNAHEACKTSENKQKLIGGGIGAIAGAVIGSQVSGNGARTEGSAIGAVIGGLAGGGIADKRIDCDPVYSTHTSTSYSQPTYTQSTYTQPTYSQPTYTQQTYTQPSYSQSSQNRIVYVQQLPAAATTTSTHYQTIPAQTQHYPVRTTYSDHPVYSNPSYGQQTTSSYSQPSRVETVISRPAVHTIKRRHATRHVSHSSPRYVQHRNTVHHHGKYQCVTAH